LFGVGESSGRRFSGTQIDFFQRARDILPSPSERMAGGERKDGHGEGQGHKRDGKKRVGQCF
jgi:hypothetical protein